MKQTIWKFPLVFTEQTIRLKLPGNGPQQCKPLRVKRQGGLLHVWAIVTPEATVQQDIKIRMVGTGWDFAYEGSNWVYLNTVFEETGLVWHFFYNQ